MVYIGENEHSTKILIQCDCGCGIIDITQFKDDNVVYIGYLKQGFYQHQTPIFRSIYEYLRSVWYAIRGKDYLFYDMMLQPKNVKELKNAIASLKEDE